MADELDRIARLEQHQKDLEDELAVLRGRRFSNADQLQGRYLSAKAPSDADVWKWNATTRKIEPEAPSTAVAHTLDSTHHTDIATMTEAQGDIIVRTAGSQWNRLAKGASGTFLRSDGTDPGWSAIEYDEVITAGGDIQAAHDGGATKILLLDGTHTLSSNLTITNANTEIVGQTMRGTVIEPGANSVIFSGGPDFCSIRNLTVKDGSDATGSVQAIGGVTGFLAERLYFTNNSGVGLLIGDNGSTPVRVNGVIFQQTAGTALHITDETQVSNCQFNISSANGILVDDTDGKGAGRIGITICFFSNGNYAVKVNSSSARVQFSGNLVLAPAALPGIDHVSGVLTCTGNTLISASSATESTIKLDAIAIVAGNYIDRGNPCVEVLAANCEIAGNRIRRSPGDGIKIDGNFDDCVIGNNRIDGCTGYGVNIASALANDTIVALNNLKGNTAGGLQDLGTDSRIRFNPGA